MFRVLTAAAVLGLALASACSSTSTTKNNPTDAASGTGGMQGGTAGAAGGGTGGTTGGSGGTGGSSGTGGTSGGDASAGTAGSGGDAGGGTGGMDDGGNDAGSDAGAAPVTDGLLLWLDATFGVAKNTEGSVLGWADRSGNRLDAVQVIEAARPKHLLVDGRPVLEFDGVDDRLILPVGFGNWQAGVSAFFVLRPAADACQQVLQLSNGPEMDDVSFQIEPGRTFLYEVYRSYLETSTGVMVQNTTALVGLVHQPAGRAEIRLNGLVAISNPTFTLPSSLPRASNAVGDGDYETCGNYSGQLAEILLYQRELSAAETTAVEAYLRAKWACCTP